MFKKTQAVFLYAVSPVHLGAGSAIGVIDNPIQRERHTDHPCFAGSGIKGAARHAWAAQAETAEQKGITAAVFGPENNSSDFAGAVSIGDAQLLVFPVRATRKAFVYATCPTAIARAWRALALAGAQKLPPLPGAPQADTALIAADDGLLHDKKQLGLEWFSYTASVSNDLAILADWLASNAIPKGEHFAYFRCHLKNNLILIPDEDFSFFVRHSTSVEPHVRVDDESGTASDGGLFYTENLPPESLLLCLVMTSKPRKQSGRPGSGDGAPSQLTDAESVAAALRDGVAKLPGLNGTMIQIGGDATTGRGHLVPTYLSEKS